MTAWALLAGVLLLVANAFFVAVEFALVASRRTRLEPLAAGGSRTARLALAAIRDLNLQLAGAQLGITMASLGLGYVAEPAVARLIEAPLGALGAPDAVAGAVAFLVALALVVFLHLVLGEMVPKNVAISEPERTLLLLAVPNRIYLLTFRPVIHALNGIARMGVRLLRVEPRDEVGQAHSPDELAAMLQHSREEGELEDFAHALLTGALEFGRRTVDSVMVPRAQMVVVPVDWTVGQVEQVVLESGHSRLPVVRTGSGDVVGFVHAKDLLGLSPTAHGRTLPPRLVRRLLRLPGDRPLADALVSMRHAQVHVAVVTDERGEIVGLVTLEDLLEALVGEIMDETDRREL